MRIIIAGAGEVGKHLAKLLSNEEQDIIVLDNEDKRLASLENYNLMTVHGDATTFASLKSVKAGSADLFIAVTPSEAQNILSCSMAKSLGARRTVARIDNSEFLRANHKSYFATLGIDHLIYPELLVAREVASALKHTWVRNWFEMLDGELIVVGVKLRANSMLVGRQLRELSSVSRFLHINAVKRGREIIIPGGYDVIHENDIAYITTTREHIDDVITACGKTRRNIERIVIMGGNKIAVQLALLLGEQYKVKIIEPDMDRCQYLADRLPYCNIVNGEPSDTDIMEEENVADYDVIIALGDSSERNILTCVMAKEFGSLKTIAEVENIQFIPEAESLNIGSVINKQLIASSRIFQIMLDNDADDARCLALADAEVAQLEVRKGAKVTKADVKDLKLSRDMTIAGLVRNGYGQLVQGDTRLQEGDLVVVFALRGAVHKFEKMFS